MTSCTMSNLDLNINKCERSLRDPPNVSCISCPHGSIVGISCAMTIIRSNSFVCSSVKLRGKSSTFERPAATVSVAAVSIFDEVVFLDVREAAFRGGGWGCVRASLRVPFAGVFFAKEALAAAYPRWKQGWNWTRAEEEEAIQPKRPCWVVIPPRYTLKAIASYKTYVGSFRFACRYLVRGKYRPHITAFQGFRFNHHHRLLKNICCRVIMPVSFTLKIFEMLDTHTKASVNLVVVLPPLLVRQPQLNLVERTLLLHQLVMLLPKHLPLRLQFLQKLLPSRVRLAWLLKWLPPQDRLL